MDHSRTLNSWIILHSFTSMAAAVFALHGVTVAVNGDLNHRLRIDFNFVLKTRLILTNLMWNRLPMLFLMKRRFVQ